jgi:hypothetical protein
MPGMTHTNEAEANKGLKGFPGSWERIVIEMKDHPAFVLSASVGV